METKTNDVFQSLRTFRKDAEKIKRKKFPSKETKLFTVYSDVDSDIIREASKIDLYLIGGTAIEIWMNHFGLSANRKRSDNDFDFQDYKADTENIFTLKQWCETNAPNVSVDILTSSNYLSFTLPELFQSVNGIKLMHPYYLFLSKLSRACKEDDGSERFKTDFNDLKDLLILIGTKFSIEEFESYLNHFGITNEQEHLLMQVSESL